MNILVSACLLGIQCRYDGTGGACEALAELRDVHHLIPVCPEVYGGLPTPRIPAERVGDRVVTKDGRDVTEQYEKGAGEALRLAAYFGCETAILKEKSPACGYGRIHDGSFCGRMTDGSGVLAQLLREHGIRVIGDTQTEEIVGLSNDRTSGR